MKGIFVEIRKIHEIALPIIMMQVFFVLMEITDCVMASWINELSFAAISLGFSFTYFVLVSLLGVASVTAPVISQSCGKGEPEKVGPTIQYMAIIVTLLSLFIMAFLTMSFPILKGFGIEEEIAHLCSQYLDARLYGILPIAIFVVIQHFLEGIGKTVSIMQIAGLGFILNILLNFCFLNGWCGLPKLGIAGIGYATSLVEIFLLIIAAISISKKEYTPFCIFKIHQNFNPKECFNLLRIGIPIGLTVAAETTLWTSETFLVAKISLTDISAHQIAINISSLLFMIPLGISAGMYSRVGFLIGKESLKYEIKRVAWIGLIVTSIFLSISGIVVIISKSFIAGLYTMSEETIEIVLTLLIYLFFFMLIDGVQTILQGVLQGFKDTKIPMVILVFSNWGIGFFLGYYLAFVCKYGVFGFWIGNGVGLIVAILFLAIRYNRLLCQYEKGLTA